MRSTFLLPSVPLTDFSGKKWHQVCLLILLAAVDTWDLWGDIKQTRAGQANSSLAYCILLWQG